MGFGLTPAKFEKRASKNLLNFLMALYTEPIYYIADAIGWELSRIRPIYEYYTANEHLKTASVEIEPGTICSHKFILEGLKGEDGVVSIEHSFKVCPDKVKQPPDGSFIKIDGRPRVEVEIKGDFWPWAMLSTTAHAVNAIPRVVDAEPGFMSLKDLPLVTAIT